MKKPNILWLLAEDMCPNLGCYGDPDAITPNLDALAGEGIRYEHVSSTGPVCSAARTTLALGMYPSTVGTGNHRSHVKLPEYVKIFSEYMQEVGYFTAINKTDYNFVERYDGDKIRGWDTTFKSKLHEDSEDLANTMRDTWRRREDQKPFFFMHTFACTHQSMYGYPSTPEAHRQQFIPRTSPDQYRDRDQLHIPAYHPDNQDTREIWGQYHECITAMDRMVGETIDKLKEDGLYEETIIFFFGDNGMGLPSGKFSMWNEGTSVPLIVRVPEKYQHLVSNYEAGSVSDSAVTFVDFAPTALQLSGVEAPDYMQGESFLAPAEDEHKLYTFSYRNRIDSSCELVRSLRNDQYLYIRNFYPHKGWRFSPYIAISSPYFVTSWEEAVKDETTYDRKNAFFMSNKPVEELYDLVNDPDQMTNLAGEPSCKERLLDLRARLQTYMIDLRDGGLMPEHEVKKRSKNSTAYDVIHDEDQYPLERLLEICNGMLEDNHSEGQLLELLASEDALVRYWAVQSIYAKEEYNDSISLAMLKALHDTSEMVQLAAAETILMLTSEEGEAAKAKVLLVSFLTNEEDVMLPLEAADCLDRLGAKTADLIRHTKHLIDPKTITKEEGVARYVQAIEGLAKYYAEKMDDPHGYPDPESKYNQRLFELRRLKEALV